MRSLLIILNSLALTQAAIEEDPVAWEAMTFEEWIGCYEKEGGICATESDY